MKSESEKLTFFVSLSLTVFFLLRFMIGVEESKDERSQMEAEEEREHQGVDFRKLSAGRRKRGAWGKRKHAATVEGTAYRIVWLLILPQ